MLFEKNVTEKTNKMSPQEEIKRLEIELDDLNNELEDYNKITSCFLELLRRSRQMQTTFFKILNEHSEDDDEFDKLVRMIGAEEMHKNLYNPFGY